MENNYKMGPVHPDPGRIASYRNLSWRDYRLSAAMPKGYCLLGYLGPMPPTTIWKICMPGIKAAVAAEGVVVAAAVVVVAVVAAAVEEGISDYFRIRLFPFLVNTSTSFCFYSHPYRMALAISSPVLLRFFLWSIFLRWVSTVCLLIFKNAADLLAKFPFDY